MTEAQPDEGQGGGSGGLYDSYLQFVPPDQQDAARAHLEEVSKSVNSRLEEAATLRNTYEPYTNVPGFDMYTPDEMGSLFQWHQNIASDPDTFRGWLGQAAQESGLTVAESQQLGEFAENAPDDQITALQQQFDNQSAQFTQQIDDLRSQQFESAEANLIEQRFSQLEAENGLELSKEQRDMIVMLGLQAMPDDGQSLINGDDWIGAGWESFRNVWAQAQTAFVNDKAAAPPPAVSSGGAPIAEPPKTWETAKQEAAERLRQSRA
jgi:hypothetical protein